MKSKSLRASLLCAALLVGFSEAGHALTLRWDANTEPDLAGYKIYRATFSLLGRTTDQATNIQSVLKTQVLGNGTSSPIFGLTAGTTYYFRLTAFNVTGEQSGFNLSPSGGAVEVSTCLAVSAPAPAVRNMALQLTQSAPAQVANLVKTLVLVRTRFVNADTGQPMTVAPGAAAPILQVSDNLGGRRAIPMTRLPTGEFAGAIDTADLNPSATALSYYGEGPHPDDSNVVLQTVQGRVTLTGTATLLPSSAEPGLFTMPDGNPLDGDFAVRFARGDGASQVNVDVVPQAPAPANAPLVAAYDLTVPGETHALFNKPATLTLVYRDADGPDANGDGMPDGDGMEDTTGIDEKDLRVYWLDKNNVWHMVGGVVDPVRNTVTAKASHFSVFAIMPSKAAAAPQPTKAPETFLSPTLVDGHNDYATFGLDVKDLTIFDVTGRLVYRATAADMSQSAITWAGRDERGEVVSSGVYIAKIVKKDGNTVYQTLAIVK